MIFNVPYLMCKKYVTIYNMKISTEKSKVVTFRGKDPIQNTIRLCNKMIHRVNDFPYLCYKLSFTNDLDTHEKITKCNKTMGFVSSVLSHLWCKDIHGYGSIKR